MEKIKNAFFPFINFYICIELSLENSRIWSAFHFEFDKFEVFINFQSREIEIRNFQKRKESITVSNENENKAMKS